MRKIITPSKKLVTTLYGMTSLNYIAYLIHGESLEAIHKIELYGLIITAMGALAGLHGFFQSKQDALKADKEGA